MKRYIIFIVVIILLIVSAIIFAICRQSLYKNYIRLFNYAADCDHYKEKTGVWPSSLEQVLQGKGNTNSPVDIYGNPVVYSPYNPERSYGSVISLGKGDKRGGFFNVAGC